MSIKRYELVKRHHPVLERIEYKSPLTVGNGEFAFTVDVTGLQTLYEEYNHHLTPLCTMSQWGWHTTPVSSHRYAYTMDDVKMTEYEYAGRTVTYAVEQKPGDEEVYYWLRKNPHKFNLGRLGFLYGRERIKPEDISDIKQTLNLYEGMIESSFRLKGILCRVRTCCHYDSDTIAAEVESELLTEGLLSVQLIFPYGSPDISGSDWDNSMSHESKIIDKDSNKIFIERKMDDTRYYACMRIDDRSVLCQEAAHDFRMETTGSNQMAFTITYCRCKNHELPDLGQTFESSKAGWKSFWETGGIIKLHESADKRALELERRIILSRYQLRVHCCGSMPPQETGLLCNSWHGKFHLEMHLWHQAYLPLWNDSKLMERSLDWYLEILPRARENAARNGFCGAKWPKQVAYDGIDSPSPIATLLIWQQPHILYMLELAYQSKKNPSQPGTEDNAMGQNEESCHNMARAGCFLEKYWTLVKETADYMVDLAVYNKETGRYDLVPPVIPAQEAHDPRTTLNPVFEVEYWRFGLSLAVTWAKRLKKEDEAGQWLHVADNMARLPVKDGLYLAHENCPSTYEEYNVDHPMMTAVYGLIPSDRVDKDIMRSTLHKISACWKFDLAWGWDFAMMAMAATRLGHPELAIELLLMDTPNNNYAVSGHNAQIKREDLPVYLPGNGSLLLAAGMMAAGFNGCDTLHPGFPEDGSWNVEYENIQPFPY